MPEHTLLTEEEAVKVLDKLGVDRSKLPKIRKDDAAIVALERSYDKDGNKVGNIREGSIVKIIRNSKTTGEFVAYRLVIGGGEYKDRFAEKMNKHSFDDGVSDRKSVGKRSGAVRGSAESESEEVTSE